MTIVSEYNQDQLISVRAILEAFSRLASSEIEHLRSSILPYLEFRRRLGSFHAQYFEFMCRSACFEPNLSACCGFESIITFFADHVINALVSEQSEMMELVNILEPANTSGKCVYLGSNGCLWRVRPITCAMFFCDQAKEKIFIDYPEAEEIHKSFQQEEKEYTWPVKPVLFDEIEKHFIRSGLESPHLYFHRSPGLIRLKSRAGLGA